MDSQILQSRGSRGPHASLLSHFLLVHGVNGVRAGIAGGGGVFLHNVGLVRIRRVDSI